MKTEAATGLRSLDRIPERRVTLSRSRIDRALGRAAGGFGLLFGLQTLPAMIGQLDAFRPPWGEVLAGTVVAGILMVAIATVLDRQVSRLCGVFAVGYLAVVLFWPFVVVNPQALGGDKPWVWYLCTVATVNAALAFETITAAAYTLVLPLAFGLVRMLPAGGSAGFSSAALDTCYAIILGAAALIIFTTLRQAAGSVDAAGAAALSRYAAAAQQNARDLERIRVDALVHDSVLTTLLAAASAESAEQRELAVRMASGALRRLSDAEGALQPGDPPMALERLARRIRSTLGHGSPISVNSGGLRGHSVPSSAAEALFAASMQAMVNSVQHAAPAGQSIERSVTVSSTDRGCRIVVADTGIGFDEGAIPPERMGVRVSIHERMSRAGGSARIDSSPGRGSRVELVWPVPELGEAQA